MKTQLRSGYLTKDFESFTYDNGDKTINATDGSFHLRMNGETGITLKWGNTMNEDPEYLPWGPEIADVELTTICSGIRGKDGKRNPCPFCYKSNTPDGHNMSLDTFKAVFDNLNKNHSLTQIAFGVDAQCKSNPDTWNIMRYCREHGVVPNVTVSDIDEDTAKHIVELCGACAVSCYEANAQCCYDSVYKLIKAAKDLGKNNFKVNIHLMVASETITFCKSLLEDIIAGKIPELYGLYAVVFLSLKQKGRGSCYSRISNAEFKQLVDKCLDNKLTFGMDSCSAPKFLEAIKNRQDSAKLESFVESCESLLYSVYVNSQGLMYPCSFLEGVGGFGIDLTKPNTNFWTCEESVKFRDAAIAKIRANNGCNICPCYTI